MFILEVNIQEIIQQIPFLRNFFQGRGRSPRGQNNFRGGRNDQFVSSVIPLIKDIPTGGGLAGSILSALQQIAAVYSASVTNASSLFRVAIASWAVGVLTNLAAQVEDKIRDSAFKETPEGKMLTTLNGLIKGLLNMINGFVETQKQITDSTKRLNALVAKKGGGGAT